MPFAETKDVAVSLMAPLDAKQEAYAERLLAWAELLIKRRFPDLTKLDAEAIIMVESAAVARVLRNPDGTRQESLSGEYQRTIDRSSSDGVLRILDEEWALLTPESDGDASGAFSIDTVGRAGAHIPWCSMNLGALYCSCGADLTAYQYPIYEGAEL